MAQLVITDIMPRLEAAGAATKSSYDAWRADQELRDELVVAAIDQGATQRAVSAAAGISCTRVNQLLTESQPDD